MHNRAYLLVALLGLLTFALPGFAAAGQGKNLSEIALASDAAARAAAVSGPVISISPLAHDYGDVNSGTPSSFLFTVNNNGDSDLHITGATVSDAQYTVSFSNLTAPAHSNTGMTVTYTPSAGIVSSGTITVHSDATNGDFTVNVSGQGNEEPTLDTIGDKSADAFVNLNFVTTAADNGDARDDILTYSVTPALPPGATYNTSTGEFDWTPQPTDAGSYDLTFCVSDGLSEDCETITITVTAGNNPPIAVAGGPYSGTTNQPIQFNGSGSSDPDGDGLTYAWDFGDGGTGSGVSPTHTYIAANNYLVTLTVTDDGSPSLSDSDVASVQVVNAITGSIAHKLKGNVLRVNGGGKVPLGIEQNSTSPTNIAPNSITVSTTYPNSGTISSITVDPKTVSFGDLDGDGFAELDFTVPRSLLRALLSNVPNGTTVTLVVNATTTTGTPIRVTGDVTIKGGSASSVSAFASPNPFNPETAISLTLKNSGPVSVRIYSIEGRLVKTLKDEFATAGTHEVRWNGKDSNGRPVPSGMYFVKTESGADKSVFKLSLLK